MHGISNSHCDCGEGLSALQVEGDPAVRMDGLQEVNPDGAHSHSVEDSPGFGASTQGSPMRTAVRNAGMIEGQVWQQSAHVGWECVAINPELEV